MKTSTSKTTFILGVILLALVIFAYRFLFVTPIETTVSSEDLIASQNVLNILSEVESINFDTSIANEPKFQTLESIEIPLISLPSGKSNPFQAALPN